MPLIVWAARKSDESNFHFKVGSFSVVWMVLKILPHAWKVLDYRNIETFEVSLIADARLDQCLRRLDRA